VAKLTHEEWNNLWSQQQLREAEHHERLRAAVASTEPPLPADLVTAVIHLFDGDTRAIMRGHKGYVLAERRASYFTSLSIMELSCTDLLSAIDRFAEQALAEGSVLFQRNNGDALEAFEQRIQKELFATTNAAASLVDHARRIQKILNLGDYDSQVITAFGTDGLHDFVIALRVLLHHLHIVEAGWNTTNSFSEGTRTATFMVHKDAVERAIAQFPDRFGGKKGMALHAFVQAAPNTIDLKTTFEEYRRRMRPFHAWFKQQLDVDSLVALRNYDHIMLGKKRLSTRMLWNMLLGNWLRNGGTPPNPHNHLRRYLTSDQLAQVYGLPCNSKEQVDLVISYIDTDHAIDDKVRELAYELFARATPPEDTALLKSA
jgi:hypothetical protein